MPVVQVTTHFNFTRTLAVEQLHIVLHQLKLVNAPNTIEVDMTTLLQPIQPLEITSAHFKLSPFAIFNLTCITIFWIILGLTFIRWRRFKAKFAARHNSAAEALPLTMGNEINPPPPTTYNIWPTLPKLTECMRNTQSADQVIQPTE